MSLELDGVEASRPFIEAAQPDHPSLLDPTHQLDALFGVVNIPNVVWIDEHGMIVRPPEPGWPGPTEYPPSLAARLAERAQAAEAERQQALAEGREPPVDLMTQLRSGQDREAYPDALRDWASRGADSPYAMSPDQVVAASGNRSLDVSAAAAHFELANHLWRAGDRDTAFAHFNACHRLQPDNWTYKRQAWSLVGNERVGGEMGRLTQVPQPGEEADWPFESNFDADVAQLEPGSYYPRTI